MLKQDSILGRLHMPAMSLLKDLSSEEGSVLSAGNIRASMTQFQTWVGDRPVELTYKEFELLRLLLSNPDRILPYDDLVGVLWPQGGPGVRRRLCVVVCRLRAKLAGSSPFRIRTVRHRGYGLTAVGSGEV
jgi:two-component system alkaline phosphatase synthesis response regulator PhoP